MSDPIIVVFFDSGGLPLPGLTPTFTGLGYYKTLAGVDTTPPAVTDGGDGDYSFTLSAADDATGVRYLLDGGATATPRFFEGEIESSAQAAVGTTVSVTGVNLFGVTPAIVRADYFPQFNDFTTDTNPSLASVLRFIDQEAAVLEAKLLQEDIDATGLLVTNEAAYLWCQATLTLQAAIHTMPRMTQQDSALLNLWRDELAERRAELAAKGYLALGGGVSAPSTQPDGPNHHIDTYGIDLAENNANFSGVTARLRRDDEL